MTNIIASNHNNNFDLLWLKDNYMVATERRTTQFHLPTLCEKILLYREFRRYCIELSTKNRDATILGLSILPCLTSGCGFRNKSWKNCHTCLSHVEFAPMMLSVSALEYWTYPLGTFY